MNSSRWIRICTPSSPDEKKAATLRLTPIHSPNGTTCRQKKVVSDSPPPRWMPYEVLPTSPVPLAGCAPRLAAAACAPRLAAAGCAPWLAAAGFARLDEARRHTARGARDAKLRNIVRGRALFT